LVVADVELGALTAIRRLAHRNARRTLLHALLVDVIGRVFKPQPSIAAGLIVYAHGLQALAFRSGVRTSTEPCQVLGVADLFWCLDRSLEFLASDAVSFGVSWLELVTALYIATRTVFARYARAAGVEIQLWILIINRDGFFRGADRIGCF
jgi:hypothetical protein